MTSKAFVFFLSLCAFTVLGCKSLPQADNDTSFEIIGSWEGCDGRVVTFTREESGEIYGRYTKLGRLGQYGFEENEIGYKIRREKPGRYSGSVKWRNTRGEATWRKITVNLKNGGQIWQDDSSDSCAKEMTRVN